MEQTRLTDREVVARCQAGDQQAFRTIVERYQGVLQGTAFLMTRDAALAEDLAQDALVAAWRAMGGLHDGAAVKAWLVRILINVVTSHQRRRELPVVPMGEGAEPGAADPAIEHADARDAVERALAGVTDDERHILLLRYYADLTVPEVAAALGVAEGTVKSRLSRLLARLREELAEGRDQPAEGTEEG